MVETDWDEGNDDVIVEEIGYELGMDVIPVTAGDGYVDVEATGCDEDAMLFTGPVISEGALELGLDPIVDGLVG